MSWSGHHSQHGLGHGSGRARINKPVVTVLDRGSLHLRGAQVRAIDGDEVTLRIHLEANIIGDRICDAALFERTPAVGNPVVARVSDDYQILGVEDAGPADHALEAAWVSDRTTFSPGKIEETR